MTIYEVSQRVIQTIVYHVEATDEIEALALVNGGEVPEAFELSGDILTTVVKPLGT